MPWSPKDLPPSVKNKNWSANQIEVFCHAANAALKEYGDDGQAIAVGISAADKSSEKTNASQFPRIFYAKNMQTGTAKYENETILVETDVIKEMMPSAVGKPVYINHKNVDLTNLKETAAGYITESFYNELDGWVWFKFLAVDDEAHEAVKKGWSVSNAYKVIHKGPKGTWHNCDYDYEVKNAEFSHLAIVPDPRYEGACIMTPEEFKNYQGLQKAKLVELQNSKLKGEPYMKFFKMKKEEVSTIDADTLAELPDGSSVKVSDMVAAVVKNSKEEKEKENGDEMVDVQGEKMPLKELVNKYCKLNKKTKKNGSEEETPHGEDEDVEGDEEEEGEDEIGDGKKNKKVKKNKKMKKNESEEEEEEEEKTNSVDDSKLNIEFFNELRNAHLTIEKVAQKPMVELSIDKLERGKKRYGSGK